MERLVRSCYKKKSGYVFAKKAEDIAREYGIGRIARLASNENPEPPCSAAVSAAEEALRETANRYPDERVNVLMHALRSHPMEIITSSPVSAWMVSSRPLYGRSLNPGEKVAVSIPTFSFYALAAMGEGVELIAVPLGKRTSQLTRRKRIRGSKGRQDHRPLLP